MSAKKPVVSTYLQYVVIGAAALMLFAPVRQPGAVLLTFLLAGVLALDDGETATPPQRIPDIEAPTGEVTAGADGERSSPGTWRMEL